MSRYIDAEKLLDEIHEKIPNRKSPFTRAIIRIIYGQPEADVVEVRHGTWLPISSTTAKCSSCNTPWNTHGADLTGNALVHKALYKYCPNCGAKIGDREC